MYQTIDISANAKVLFLNRYIKENVANTINRLRKKTRGSDTIRPKASGKLFLRAASRPIFIAKEYITRNIKDGMDEHIKESKRQRPFEIAHLNNKGRFSAFEEIAKNFFKLKNLLFSD